MSKDNHVKDTHPVLCESNRGSWSTCASNRILTISNGDTPPDYDELFHIDCFQNSVFEEDKGSKSTNSDIMFYCDWNIQPQSYFLPCSKTFEMDKNVYFNSSDTTLETKHEIF